MFFLNLNIWIYFFSCWIRREEEIKPNCGNWAKNSAHISLSSQFVWFLKNNCLSQNGNQSDVETYHARHTHAFYSVCTYSGDCERCTVVINLHLTIPTFSHTPLLSLPFCLCYFPGPIIISQCPPYWSTVRRLGAQVLLAAYRLLHVCPHSTNEDQPMVSEKHGSQQIKKNLQ